MEGLGGSSRSKMRVSCPVERSLGEHIDFKVILNSPILEIFNFLLYLKLNANITFFRFSYRFEKLYLAEIRPP